MLRLDSEYQKTGYLAAIAEACKFGATQLKDDNPSIIHPQEIVRDYVEDEGVWFLRAQNVRPLLVDTTNRVLILDDDAAKLTRNRIERGDVLVTRTGANRGQCAYFDREEVAIASSHTFIIRTNTIDPEYLAVFLNTRNGIAQIDKGVYGAAQPEIAPYYLKNIWVPDASAKLVSSVKQCFSQSKQAATLAEQAISQAEDKLLEALGLADWTPPEPLSYAARASDAFVAGRLDARFFAPRIQALLDILGRDGRSLGDVATSRRQKFRPQDCATFNYIEIGDIDGAGAATSTHLACADAPSRATWHVRPNDIITSTVRPIRRLSAQIAPDQDGYVASSGFVVIDPQQIAPELLLTFLRLPVICELLDLYASASMYPAVTEAHILGLPFPEIDAAVQGQVVANIREVREAKEQVARLLEAAKRAVEIAIEDGEDVALTFLDKMTAEN